MMTFVRLGLKLLRVKSRANRTIFVTCITFLKVFDEIQNGGKSHMAQNDVIGCAELVLIQGFQRYPNCEIWANGSKVMMLNAFQN